MFVFEAALSDGFDEVFHASVRAVLLESLPDGVVSWGSRVCADGFLDESFPPVGSVVHSLSEGCVAV